MTTKKRFRISQGYNDKFCHDWEKNKLLNFRQTVDLLNNLNDENEELKEFIKSQTPSDLYVKFMISLSNKMSNALKMSQRECEE